MVEYIPSQRDIVYLNFNPQTGHEQMGRRPALVLSNYTFNKFTKLALVCPITNNMKEFPFHYPINNDKITGVVMCEQIKSIDFVARCAEFKCKISENEYDNIIDIINSFIDIEKNPD